MQKRVLFIYHVSAVGGGSYCLLNLLKAIDRRIFEPVVLLPQKGPLCDEIDKLNIKIVYYPSIVLYPYNKSLFKIGSIKTIIKIFRNKKGFKKVLRSISPDIVYCNTMMLFPYLKHAKELGCKTVLHVREHWPLDEHIHQLRHARDLVERYADKVIAINRYSASIFPKNNATIVYDWIDMEARRGGASLSDMLGEECEDKTVYLFTGGLQKIKGTIEVLSVFSQTIIGDDRRLLVLGVDPTLNWKGLKGCIKLLLSKIGYKTYMEKVVNLCKNDNRIKCAPSIYNITDIMEKVAGNISYFTMPHANLALAESIILRVPTVAAKTDESLEYSNEGVLSLLYKLGDRESFRKTWKSLDCGNDNLIKTLDKQSLVIKEKFDPKNNASIFNLALREMF